MDGFDQTNELSKCLGEALSLYDEVIAYENELIEILRDSSLDMDSLDNYLEHKDDLAERLEILSDKLGEQTSGQELSGITDSNVKALCDKLVDKQKILTEFEVQARKAIEAYIGNMRTGISTSRKNASKAQKYMSNMNGISLAADTYIDTSKKI